MPTLTLEDDPNVFTFDKGLTRTEGSLNIDGLELATVLRDMGVSEENQPSTAQLAEAAKKVAWPAGIVNQLTEAQLASCAIRVINRMEELGNAHGTPRECSPPTASSHLSTNGATANGGGSPTAK